MTSKGMLTSTDATPAAAPMAMSHACTVAYTAGKVHDSAAAGIPINLITL
jgi:hypothetical protein